MTPLEQKQAQRIADWLVQGASTTSRLVEADDTPETVLLVIGNQNGHHTVRYADVFAAQAALGLSPVQANRMDGAE